MLNRLLTACLICASCGGCATISDIGRARGAVVADNVVSQVVISTVPGAAEVGLGWWGLPLRLGALEYAKTQPPEKAQETIDAVKASGYMGTASALLGAAGAGPAGVVVALVVGYASWQNGAEKREALEACAYHKRVIPESAALPCVIGGK